MPDVNLIMLGRGDAETFLVILFLVIAGVVNLVRWLASKAQEPQEPSPQPRGESPRPASQQDPAEVLKRFLEEMTGAPASPPQSASRPHANPQRGPLAASPPHRPARQTPSQRPFAPGADEVQAREEPRTVPAVSPDSETSPLEEPAPDETQPGLAQAKPLRESPKGQPAAADWLDRLPGTDLQRAIVLREILGQPRALQRHPRR